MTMDGSNILNEQRMPRKAKAILNKLLQSRQITEQGLRFLICATDPFHDTEVCSDGYPDVNTTRSITQCVTKSVTVGPPTGVTGSWDAHLFFAPLTPCFSQMTSTTTATTTVLTTTTTTTDGVVKLAPNKLAKASSEKDIRDARNRKRKRLADESSDEEILEATSKQEVLEEFRRKKNKLHKLVSTYFSGYFRTTMDVQGQLNQTGFSLPVFSGWNCITVAGGVDWLEASSGNTQQDISLPPTYTTGYWRLVGVGLEVTNTTAQLYKGGSVVVYKSPSPFQRSMAIVPDVGNYPCSSSTMPPSNVADATLYPNSKTWAAEDGCYLIATQNTVGNDYVTPVPGFGSLLTPSSFTDLDTGAGWAGYFPLFNPDGTISIQSSLSTNLPFDTTGAVFTGLNNNSSLTVTVRYYLERHPTIADPDLLVLARTPAPYDPVALEIYSRAMNEMPVGVPVGENPMGEWFNDVISAVAEWAPKIGKALGSIGVPLAQPIGTMVGAFAKGRLVERKTIKKTPKGQTVTTTVMKKGKKKKKPVFGPKNNPALRFQNRKPRRGRRNSF